jgi:hypothetical protein
MHSPRGAASMFYAGAAIAVSAAACDNTPPAPTVYLEAKTFESVTVGWSDDGAVDFFEVLRSPADEEDFAVLARIAGSDTGATYVDCDLEPDTAYRYKVKALEVSDSDHAKVLGASESKVITITTDPACGCETELRTDPACGASLTGEDVVLDWKSNGWECKPRLDTQRSLGRVCQGEAVDEAAAYDPARSGVHPVVVLDGEGVVGQGSFCTPESWAPSSLEQAELVLCAAFGESLIRTCSYEDGYTRDLYVESAEVKLREARTGTLVAEATVLAQASTECPTMLIVSEGEKSGKIVQEEPVDLAAWLRTYVEK